MAKTYCSVSVMSLVSKIFEKLVKNSYWLPGGMWPFCNPIWFQVFLFDCRFSNGCLIDLLAYIVSIAKIVSIRSMKFSLPRLPFIFKLTIWPSVKYCRYVLTVALSLQKLQKWTYRTPGPSLATSLEPLAHHWNVASLSLYYWCYCCRYLSEMSGLVPLAQFLWEVYSLFR